MNINVLKRLEKSRDNIHRLLYGGWFERNKYKIKVMSTTMLILVAFLFAYFSFLWVMTEDAVEYKKWHRNQHEIIQRHIREH